MNSHREFINLMENLPQTVTVTFKTADTGKYIFSNAALQERFGDLFPRDLVGLTVRDLNYAFPAWGGEHSSRTEAFDLRVREHKASVTDKRAMRLNSGAIVYEEMTKSPVLGIGNHVLGVVTYGQDLTPTLSCTELYRQYQCFHNKQEAIRRVLIHIDADANFTSQPTEAQFEVFLEKVQGRTSKEIAQRLELSHRTVESHLAALRDKVVGGDLRRALSLIKQGGASCEN
ncbi:LuxR C-terminal-related transcriptional regulator [Burkholderia sp. L27(2015)]|jgi:hypothetical protein|uniref:LuxR C-terminal-related transcriptional regulator n=1 Tax=Burkholderia sp. L27(2015) TaxID=1641858 RepID=UPI00131C1B62|nr:LuxR C-terminal-related transcriptional regulator [Burkholderia sp. L27(2015)]